MTRSAADTAAARDGLRAHINASRLKKGDIIAWAAESTSTHLHAATATYRVYHIGLVTYASKDGRTIKADTGFGAPQVVDLSIDSAGVRGDRIDVAKARAWLALPHWPQRDAGDPLTSMSACRDIVRQWLIP